MCVEPNLEHAVLAEMRRGSRGARRCGARHDWPRTLIEGLHRGQHELLDHLDRVAGSVPAVFRPVAWLHHAGNSHLSARDLAAAGLSEHEIRAVALLADADPLDAGSRDIQHVRDIAAVPGTAGRIARVVGRAALADLLRAGHPVGDRLDALGGAA